MSNDSHAAEFKGGGGRGEVVVGGTLDAGSKQKQMGKFRLRYRLTVDLQTSESPVKVDVMYTVHPSVRVMLISPSGICFVMGVG